MEEPTDDNECTFIFLQISSVLTGDNLDPNKITSLVRTSN